ncbi:interleukin-12 subunit beta [Oncorhynchus nerka]|uniref:interleukin-12 subunit beta n=1 Tax=Oncorhynchus nerka TaxID=8023 RepID=UPI001130422F|nr:interleukin-12 subunit beta-like [Oncorhynchus nerka]
MTVVPWLIMLLCVILPRVNGLTSFHELYIVDKGDNLVTLTCPTAFSGAMTWKYEGETEDLDKAQVQGRNLILNEVDWYGEYSCWDGDKKLGSIYLLEELKDPEEQDDYLISCRAKSYGCTFNCSWTHSEFTAVRLGLGHDCTDSQESCTWVYPTTSLQDGGLEFELTHSLSPYTEEAAPLVVTVEAIARQEYLRKTKRFYLHDIVQPDSPAGMKCQVMDQRLKVKVEPPATWNCPPSYFPLEHQIGYIFKDNGKEEHSMNPLIPRGVSKLRARSRDPLVPSPWSQWTPWKNVVTGGKKEEKCKEKRRGKESICCKTGEKKRTKTKSRSAFTANE